MSIIFQKLKDLKQKSSGREDLPGAGFQHPKNILTFKKFIFSTKGVLLAVTIIAGFGLLSFYSLSFLKNRLDSASDKAVVVQHSHEEPMPGNDILPDTGGMPVPPPGSELPKGPEIIQSRDTVPGQGLSSKKPEKFKVPEYFINKTKGKTGIEPLKTFFLPSLKNFNKPSLVSLPQKALKPLNPEKDTRPEAVVKKVSREKKNQARKEVLRLAKKKRTRKVSDIAMLATDIEQAFEENDNAGAYRLLAKLEKEKGNNSPYYLKLKAFMEIRQNNYSLARKLLNKVLAKEKNDFDAGINMAIIEIREKKFARARQRLIKLKELYPSRSMIDDLINRL
ncbi:MAG: tetratricopeptide repeat protein [Deltaproteobacteria bacterium]|nr:tetratricopeptide repeat protein [Deltaproteobacteria bacterium]